MTHTITRDEVSAFDRLPPHSTEAEMCLLASMMLDKEMIAQIIPLVTRDAFFQADHQIIFDVLVKLHQRHRPIDAVILREELLKRQLLDVVGGVAYIAAILNSVPSAAHGVQYAKTIKEKYGLRMMLAASNDIQRAVYAATDGEPVPQIAMKFAAEFAKIGATGQGHRILSADEVLESFVANRADDEAFASQLIKTGLTELDENIGGLRKGRLYLAGAKPGMGKSMLSKQIFFNIARRGVRCGLISVEEDREKIAENLLSNTSGVDNWKIAQNTLDPRERESVQESVYDLKDLPLFTMDTAFVLSDIIAAIHQLVLQYKCEVIAIDHLHLIDGQMPKANKTQEVSAISRALKMTIRELNVASLVTAQLNRGGEAGNNSREPVMRDLRESGSLEADGDVILLLHREDYYHETEADYHPSEQLKVIVAKHKSSGTGFVTLHFDKRHQRVQDRKAHEFPTFS